MKTAIFRRETFNAAHRLFNPAWDDATNACVFGACSNPNYHGHNYTLVVRVSGETDPETGYVMDLGLLKTMIREEVTEPFDHSNLNLDVPEFRDLNPTAENIAAVIYRKLRRRIKPAFDLTVRLYETENNFVEYPG